MHLIKNISVDGDKYVSSKIVARTPSNSFAVAQELLIATAIEMVKEEFGREAAKKSKVIDIHSLDQINAPLLDGMLLYRLTECPEVIMIYQKRTTSIKQEGYLWSSEVSMTEFRKTNLLEIEASDMTLSSARPEVYCPPVEMVPAGPSGKIQIPKPMQQSPICDLIEELKRSVRFQSLHRE